MIKTVSAAQLRRMFDDGGELAVLDVREEGVYSRDGHLLLVSNVPLSVLELRVTALVPRLATRIVVCDGGEGLAAKAAQKLIAGGYTDVRVLDGGTPAWAAAGFRLYTGVYVPSKAFGEYIQHEDAPQEVTATELAEWQKTGKDIVVVDSRQPAEFRRNSIPGAFDCPSAELPYRMKDFVRTPQTTVVVNCGGRTRSIIGAQVLINAGFPNPVYALKDGTQGWKLAGFTLNHGCEERVPLPTDKGLAWAQQAAARVAKRYGIRSIDYAGLQALRADAARTVYLLDVRNPEEFDRGHWPGALSAPGGQLVQATDTFIAVRPAVIVLADNDGVRATMTASWLLQMGHDEVYVLAHGDVPDAAARGPAPEVLLEGAVLCEATVSAAELKQLLAAGSVQVVDLDSSLRYREGHIPGAWHVVRSRLAEQLKKIPEAPMLVFTATEQVLAALAAADAAQLMKAPVKVLAGGSDAWRAAGFTLETGDARMTGAADDLSYRALDRKDNVEQAMREYLSWEVELVHAVVSDPDFRFRRYPAAS
ncbi:MAG: sulfurtransferase [Burkholderiales bacterium]|jgi:rhodanese-related sulfurtransferase|nr:sulfurtransferase [Burkholderiales bacterium]